MYRMRRLVLMCALLLLPPVLLADGAAVEDQVSFQVEAGQDVANDRVVAVLSITAEGSKPARLAEKINAAMAWALEQARASDKVSSRSGSYQTYPVYDDRKIVRWRSRQELQLESRDVDQLSGLVGTLQSRLQVQSIQFSVSPDTRGKVEDSLIKQALAAFQARADIIRTALGAKGYRVLDINIHSGGRGPVPLRVEAASMAGRSNQPALEQGTSRVTVQVSGKIRLLRD
ncbi:MAG TPA: DUF541 domain-containing protein [Gammaproteobacteria bacterium]|nr:DUF541 domain-containing protein [Gammaproteobacteria bacterium]